MIAVDGRFSAAFVRMGSASQTWPIRHRATNLGQRNKPLLQARAGELSIESMGRLDAQLFLDRLMVHARTRIVLCNMLASLEDGLITEQFARDLLNWWHALYAWQVRQRSGGKMPRLKEQEELIGTLEALLFEPQAPGFRSGATKPDFRLACRRGPRFIGTSLEYASVTTAAGFIERNLHKSDRRRLAGTIKLRVVSVATAVHGDEVGTFMRGDPQRVRLKAGSSIGRPLGVVWMCRAKDVVRDLRDQYPADRIRDTLALIHYNTAGKALVLLHLPTEKIGSRGHHRPTFADAGNHARFKARADYISHRNWRAWGFTVNLHFLASRKRAIDGRAERVTQPIRAEVLGEAFVTPIGSILQERVFTKGVDDDDAFTNRLCSWFGGPAAVHDRVRRLLE